MFAYYYGTKNPVVVQVFSTLVQVLVAMICNSLFHCSVIGIKNKQWFQTIKLSQFYFCYDAGWLRRVNIHIDIIPTSVSGDILAC